MAVTFRPSRDATELALRKMKEDGLVHPEAVFNDEAEDGLRKEVARRDWHFGRRLGRTALETVIVDDALDLLKERGLVPPDADYDRDAVAAHRQAVQEFEGSWTTLSPTMERLMYMMTSVRGPKHMLELGCFWGYTLAWFAGPCLGVEPPFGPERIIGIDLEASMIERAKANFARLKGGERVELIAEDARTALDRIEGPFDFVYLEAKFENRQIAAAEAEGFKDPMGPVPHLYLVLLKQIYDRLPAGAWVIAHDNLDWVAKREIAPYLEFVRDKAHFSESVCFDIDDCGMELSVK